RSRLAVTHAGTPGSALNFKIFLIAWAQMGPGCREPRFSDNPARFTLNLRGLQRRVFQAYRLSQCLGGQLMVGSAESQRNEIRQHPIKNHEYDDESECELDTCCSFLCFPRFHRSLHG